MSRWADWVGRCLILVAATMVGGCGAENHAASSTPGLDATFGRDGIVTATEMGLDLTTTIDIAEQADGRFVGLGYSGQPYSNSKVELFRLNTDGTLDETFGASGHVVLSRPGFNEWATEMTVDDEGRLYVVGTTTSIVDQGSELFVARVSSEGKLDTGFGADGFAVTDTGDTEDNAYAVAVQPDGKVLLLGGTWREVVPVSNTPVELSGRGAIVIRYNADGSLDRTFGDAGFAFPTMDGLGFGTYDMVLQPGGGILVVGRAIVTSESRSGLKDISVALVRIMSDGSIDKSFGRSGVALLSIIGVDWGNLAIDQVTASADGGGMILGSTVNDLNWAYPETPTYVARIFSVRFGPEGEPLSGSDSGGVSIIDVVSDRDVDFLNVSDVARADDGSFVAAVRYSPSSTVDVPEERVAVMRLSADGTFDRTFAGGGQLSPSIPTPMASVFSVAVTSAGSILLGGSSQGAGGEGVAFITRLPSA